jgi:Flp pilus assembly pilin Flp
MATRLRAQFALFVRSEDGPVATENATPLALVVLVAIVSIMLLGSKIDEVYERLSDVFDPLGEGEGGGSGRGFGGGGRR